MQHHTHSHHHKDIVHAKNISVFLSGDSFFSAKKVVVNPRSTRSLEALLIRLTEILKPRFGAVLHLKTVDGSSEVRSLEDLEPGACYVAYGKKFHPME